MCNYKAFFSYLFGVIVRVKVVFRKTVVGVKRYKRFDDNFS